VATKRQDDLGAVLGAVVDEAAERVHSRIRFLKVVRAAPGYARFRSRALAYLVDGALVAAVLALSGVLSFMETAWIAAVLTAAAQVLPFAYLTLSHYGTGQTIGKRLLGIRVIDEVFARLSLRQSALRSVVALGGPVISAAAIVALTHAPLPVWLIAVVSVSLAVAGNAWALVDSAAALGDGGRRTFHDRISGTVVVEVGR
jgi:uncharacterized RDD family membrane protein YckC